MQRFRPGWFLLLCLATGAAGAAEPDIPFRKEVLGNGLTVIVHEDHDAPIVAVNVWYHVGSKNEVPGRTGFAHLFEHLMFQGSENHDEEALATLEDLGATDFNATTWFDRTNYFQTVPKNALDSILWMESDRMGHFIGSVDQAKLDEQRGVVQNEKRQGDNQPYGRVWEYLQPALFPPGHPYSWETIGSMADLDAATLDDVREWFATWYGPNNAVLVIAGDVDTEAALAKVRQYFGDIPPSRPLNRPGAWIPRHDTDRRIVLEERVPQARLYRAWTGPQWGSADSRNLALATAVLAGDKNSRLYQRLVYRDRLATDISLAPIPLEISGITYLVASAAPGVELAAIESAINEELALFARKGPTARELERVTTGFRAQFLRSIEQVGGYGGKAGTLAEGMVYGGRPDAWKEDLAALDRARPDDLRRVAAAWLGQGSITLSVLPFPGLAPAAAGVDRSTGLPAPGPVPAVGFPAVERATLANGLELVVAPRSGTGLVELRLVLGGGYASDPAERPGTSSVAMAMLDEGTAGRSALQISEQLDLLGASLGTAAGLDASVVSLSALRDRLSPSLEIFADVVLNPSFPANELDRLRGVFLAGLSQEKSRPNSMALRVLPRLLYGEGHPYAQPLTGTGTEASLRALQRTDLAAFHAAWFKPDHATLVAAGDVTLAELRPLVEKLFGRWQPGATPVRTLPPARPAAPGTLWIVDRPGADQSVIFAGQTVPARADTDEFALQMLNNVLGGQASARINMNLREDKHWAYGAYTVLLDARGERPYFAYAPVQTDRTADALKEIKAELAGIVGQRPVDAKELGRVQRTEVLGLPGRWETSGAVAGALVESVRYDLPADYWPRYAGAVEAVTLEDVRTVAAATLQPGRQVWVVVGDRAKIEPGLRALGFTTINTIDADGVPVAP